MNKIYFACSIRGGRQDVNTYGSLVGHIKTRAEVLTEIFADQKLTADGMNKPSRDIWDIDTNWIRLSDAVIAEVSNPSLGVGYEIAKAEEWGKPVLALYHDDTAKKLSAMIDGSPKTQVVCYSDLNVAYQAINSFLDLLPESL